MIEIHASVRLTDAHVFKCNVCRRTEDAKGEHQFYYDVSFPGVFELRLCHACLAQLVKVARVFISMEDLQ